MSGCLTRAPSRHLSLPHLLQPQCFAFFIVKSEKNLISKCSKAVTSSQFFLSLFNLIFNVVHFLLKQFGHSATQNITELELVIKHVIITTEDPCRNIKALTISQSNQQAEWLASFKLLFTLNSSLFL